ncbi:peptidase domain-containing ABC transporter [Streptomyces sp. NPDC059443]|uniref:peptidase domain-containing ABC transporter n=1 Tax=unclassified Streptomyces TaxID=2593676 RepID=UPI0036A71763
MKWQRYHTHQDGETDCGPASVRTVLRRHGVFIDQAILRESVGLGDDGSSLLQLRGVLAGYGIDTELLRLDTPALATAVRVAGPAIVLLDDDGFRHFVVVHAIDARGDFQVSDPLFHRVSTISAALMTQLRREETLVTERPPTRGLARAAWTGRFGSSTLLRQAAGTHKRALLAILAATVVVSTLALAISLFVQLAVDEVVKGSAPSSLALLSLSFLTVAIAATCLQYARGRLVVTLSQRMQRQLSHAYVSKLFRLPWSFFRTRRTGDLAGRLDDVQEIQTLVTSTTIGATVDLFVVLTVGGYLLYVEPVFFLLLLGPAAVNVGSSLILYPSIREAAEESLQRDATLKSEAVNLIRGVSEIQAYGRRDYATSRISSLLDRRIVAEQRLGRLENTNLVIKLGTQSISTILITWLALTFMNSGSLTVGQVFGYLTMAGYFLGAMESMASLQVTLQRTSAALGRYRDISLQRDDEKLDRAEGEMPDTAVTACDIDIERLSFKPSRREDFILKELSLRIAFGSSTLIHGANGAGKSTLLRFMSGLQDDYTGTVRLGGVEVRELPDSVVRRKILYVPEAPTVLTAALRENLAFGGSHTDDEIFAACRVACFDEVLRTLPQGLDTALREDGTELSRGELQRMSLARAVLHDPAVFLFDESFGGIDDETFTRIWANLSDLAATKIVVAHGAVRDASFDQRVALDAASLTHGELV